MDTLKIAKAPELVALLDADPVYARRYEQCLRDIRKCKTVEDLKRCKSAGNLKRGYGQEWTSHHGMKQRAAKNSIALSPELRHFPDFLVHVGPKPHYEEVRKLSIDKTNSKGYIIGFVRWETPDQQTRNRAISKFHLYAGRYYNDKQLADLLTKLGHKLVRTDTVKRRRLRRTTTAEQFAMESILYNSGLDVVSHWDFPHDYATKMYALYRTYHRKGESRISFFVRWLQVELDRLMQIEREPGITREHLAKLRSLRLQIHGDMHDAREELRILQRQKIDDDIAGTPYQPTPQLAAAASVSY